jgi:hypothetical protein
LTKRSSRLGSCKGERPLRVREGKSVLSNEGACSQCVWLSVNDIRLVILMSVVSLLMKIRMNALVFGWKDD